jgi:hypothetical protein
MTAYTRIDWDPAQSFSVPVIHGPDSRYVIHSWRGTGFHTASRDWLLILDTTYHRLFTADAETGTVAPLDITPSGLPVFQDTSLQIRYGTISTDAIMEYLYTHGVPDFGPGATIWVYTVGICPLIPGEWRRESNQPDHLQEPDPG